MKDRENMEVLKRGTFLSIAAQGVAAQTVFPSFGIGRKRPSANRNLNLAFIGPGGRTAQQPYAQL